MPGALVAFEGIDQAGKMTQARAVGERLHGLALACELKHYPDYRTAIGRLIERALCGELSLDAQARTMLFAANRWEKDAELRRMVQAGTLVLVDRYSASNIVYGLSQGYDEAWLRGLEAGLVEAQLTFFIDITPEESVRRKSRGRDDFERDLTLLETARRHYQRLAHQDGWLVIDGAQKAEAVQQEILAGLEARFVGRIPQLANVGRAS